MKRYFMSVSKHSLLIGVDLGGTNVRAGLVQNGKIIDLQKRDHSSVSRARRDDVIDGLCEIIAAVMHPGVKGIGLGVPAVVKDGIVYRVNNIPCWRKVPLQKILARRFHLPVFIENDANCFAVGELHFGAGRGYKNLVGLIVGTGLGAGVIVNGKLYSGTFGGAGEIGSVIHREKDFEYYCSGRFFQRKFGMNGAVLYARAKKGDRMAQAMLASFGDEFANVIMAAAYTYDPEIIVLGGAVSKAYPYFKERMWKGLRAFKYQNNLEKMKIVQTEKPNIAVLAAAALCLDGK